MSTANLDSDASAVFSAERLTRRFGNKTALDGLTLEVPRGIILGLLGDNGAGKTTTLRMALGLLAPTRLTILGADPQKDGPKIRERIGYVPEDRRLYPQMRVRRIVRYARSFHPSWDRPYESELLDRFNLDPASKIKALSRGALAKLHLLMALAPRPELLILDEATGGIDALARREILGNLVELVGESRMSVIFASHVLPDVERIADRVAVLHQGQLVRACPLDQLKSDFTRVRVRFDEKAPEPPPCGTAGISSVQRRGCEWLLTTTRSSELETLLQRRRGDGEQFETERIALTLEDIFVELIQTSGESR